MSSNNVAKPSDQSNSPTVLLVHGAWADGSSWSKVIALLKTKGIKATAVQLPLATLAGDVATVKRAIALQSGPLVLAGHSYGGAVITEAGNDPKVGGLVFVAASHLTAESLWGVSAPLIRPRRSARNCARTPRRHWPHE